MQRPLSGRMARRRESSSKPAVRCPPDLASLLVLFTYLMARRLRGPVFAFLAAALVAMTSPDLPSPWRSRSDDRRRLAGSRRLARGARCRRTKRASPLEESSPSCRIAMLLQELLTQFPAGPALQPALPVVPAHSSDGLLTLAQRIAGLSVERVEMLRLYEVDALLVQRLEEFHHHRLVELLARPGQEAAPPVVGAEGFR